ncbi:hypothetical protein [Novosphingobium sp. THN1]|uniref:hypothetical protein n=1 Tax=Novosphingobium sp. THN1 TaxID=1016987 RepID=UPI0013C3267C|nr:hypothetical protein [Novosphingobium sp. THN1]
MPGGTSLTLLSQCRDEAQISPVEQKSKPQYGAGLGANGEGIPPRQLVANFTTVQQNERKCFVACGSEIAEIRHSFSLARPMQSCLHKPQRLHQLP